MKLCLTKVIGLFFLLVFSIIFDNSAYGKPSIQDYAALPSVSQMRLSPNGELIAFIKKSADKDMVVLYSLSQKKMLNGAALGELTPESLYFASDQHLIIVASKYRRVSGYRGAFDLSTAYVMDTKDGKVRKILTPGDVVSAGQIGLGNIVGLTPDKKRALMPAYVRGKYALVSASLISTRSPRVVQKGSPSTVDYFVNANGKAIVEERFSNKINLHQIYSMWGDEKKIIYSNETERRNLIPVGLTQQQDALVVEGIDEKTERRVLYTMSLKDGKISKPIFSRKNADIEGIVLKGVSRIVHGVSFSGFNPSYEFFDKKLEKRVLDLLKELPEQTVWLSDWSEDFSDLIVSVSGSMSSGDYFLSSKGKGLTFLAATRSQVKAKDINRVAQFSYKARDGLNIPALLTIPISAKSLDNLPAIMLPHGGPESYDRMAFGWLSQALANEGYLVIQPQFRGSSGFGYSHTKAGFGEWGKKMQSDLTDGVNALVKEGIIDPEKICIVGWSYGGYAALAGATFTPEVYQCSVSINGVSDLPLMMEKELDDYGSKHWAISYWNKQFTGNKAENEKKMKESSPVYFAEKVNIPVLLIHGTKDRIVDIEQSERMEEALKEANKSVEFKSFEDEDHDLSGSKTRLEVLTSVVKFVNQHLGD